MPYNNEYASQKVIQSLMNNPKFINRVEDIKNNLNVYDVRKNKNNLAIHGYSSPETSKFKYIMSFDGSKLDLVEEQYGVSICNIGAVLIDINKMNIFLKAPYYQSDLDTYKEEFSIHCTLPVYGFLKGNDKESDVYREFLYENIKDFDNNLVDKYCFDVQETILDTFKAILSFSNDIETQPCPICSDNGYKMTQITFKVEGEYSLSNLKSNPELMHQYKELLKKKNELGLNILQCECESNKVNLFITDLMKSHNYINDIPDETSDSWQEKLSNKVMLFLEKLYFINFIRNAYINNRFDILNDTLFVIDGPLAMFGDQSWFALAIEKDLFTVQENCKLLVVGVEKSGLFKSFSEKSFKNTENQSFILFDDNLIREKIYLKKSFESFYGERTHFGKKMWLKNSKGASFIINIAFKNFEDKYESFYKHNDEESLMAIEDQLEEIFYMCEKYSSQMYNDGLFPVSLANGAISLSGSAFWKGLFKNMVR